MHAGALTILGAFVCTDPRKMGVINLDLDWHLMKEPHGTSGLKEGAAGEVGE
jgi:hypothetical protein